jgi:dihydrofolate reductase
LSGTDEFHSGSPSNQVEIAASRRKESSMRELVSYMFTSLDGFIADADGGLEWPPIDEQLMRFANDYFSAADGIVFGRKNYEMFVSYWDGLDPAVDSVADTDVEFAQIFRKMTRIVVSRTLREVGENATLINDDVAGRISALKEEPGRSLLLICGPELRSTLTRLGLIDRYKVLVSPVVLGKGVPQFEDAQELMQLRLTGTRVFDGGVVMLDYEPQATT